MAPADDSDALQAADLYALLELDPNADHAQVRRAFRRLALRWHPDRAGPAATVTFQKISAAYAVLCDPVARAKYDRRRPPRAAAPATTPRRRAPGVMLTRLCGPLNGLVAGGIARHAEPGVIELYVNAQEAAQGGMATISMRVKVRCRECGAPSCPRCGNTGTGEELFSAWLAMPPEVQDGAMLDPSELLRGMLRPVRFRVRVRRRV